MWIDQLMCAAGAVTHANQWLNDSFDVMHKNLKGDLHFDFWTWKGNAADDPQGMSVLVTPTDAQKLDLSSYKVDDQVLKLYRSVFQQSGTSNLLKNSQNVEPQPTNSDEIYDMTKMVESS